MIFGTVYRQAAIFHLISDGLECIHYARANKCTWIGRIWKKWFSGITSHGLKWENKIHKLKASISTNISCISAHSTCYWYYFNKSFYGIVNEHFHHKHNKAVCDWRRWLVLYTDWNVAHSLSIWLSNTSLLQLPRKMWRSFKINTFQQNQRLLLRD